MISVRIKIVVICPFASVDRFLWRYSYHFLVQNTAIYNSDVENHSVSTDFTDDFAVFKPKSRNCIVFVCPVFNIGFVFFSFRTFCNTEFFEKRKSVKTHFHNFKHPQNRIWNQTKFHRPANEKTVRKSRTVISFYLKIIHRALQQPHWLPPRKS